MTHKLGSKYNILGVDIDILTRELFLKQIKEKIIANHKVVVFTPYSEFIYSANTDEAFRLVLNSSDINIADGVFMQIASIYLESPKKSNIKIINFFKILTIIIKMILRKVDRAIVFPELLSGSNEIRSICAMAEKQNFSIYMIGGIQNVVYRAAQELKKEFPQLNIVGTQQGQAFSPDDKKLLLDIKDKRPNILVVCYGSQKQEKWINEYRNELNANLIIGMGGTFDYLSGKKKLQSKWWSDRGLNWLHRLISEPTRWKRQSVIFKLLWILAGVKKESIL